MDLSFTPDQDALREATTRLYAKESHGERVREAEATGFDPALWAAVVQLGAVTIGVPEAAGGGGGVAHRPRGRRRGQHGAHLGSVPLVETAVAARLLAALGRGPVDHEHVGGARAAAAVDGVATLGPGRRRGRRRGRPRRRPARRR